MTLATNTDVEGRLVMNTEKIQVELLTRAEAAELDRIKAMRSGRAWDEERAEARRDALREAAELVGGDDE